MNRLCRRIGIQRAEIDEARVHVLSRANLDRLLSGHAVAHEHDVVLKSANLYGTPGNSFNDAGVFLWPNYDDVTNLKWPISVKRNTSEEVSQRVLQSKTDNDAENRRSREERPEINFRIDPVEDEDK